MQMHGENNKIPFKGGRQVFGTYLNCIFGPKVGD